MKMKIKRFSELTGVSVRTLHYYDEIGLLKPAETDEKTLYRYYDESSFERMQEILFFRELGFSLQETGKIISSKTYDKNKALSEHRDLLILKKKRLEELIDSVEKAIKKGGTIMSEFSEKQFKQYKDEAKKRWGNTKAYGEYTEKTNGKTDEEQRDALISMEEIFGEFARLMKSDCSPESQEAVSLVKKLQNFITKNFYTCTNEILLGLGQMYVFDERFKANIDKHAEGTAEFVSRAIEKAVNG